MASLAFDLKILGRRLHFDFALGHVERQKLIERLGDRDYEVGTEQHREAQAALLAASEANRADVAAAGKRAATAAAEALACEQKKVAQLEADYRRACARGEVAEAQRDAAVSDRHRVADELNQLTAVVNSHECDQKAAN